VYFFFINDSFLQFSLVTHPKNVIFSARFALDFLIEFVRSKITNQIWVGIIFSRFDGFGKHKNPNADFGEDF
jgi:hypothetical protein